MILPVKDKLKPSSASALKVKIGRVFPGVTQSDEYSCGATAAFTALRARNYVRKNCELPLSAYRGIFEQVRPTAQDGAEFAAVRRPMRHCSSYGRFRKPEVARALRDGHLVIAAIAWPTDEEPDLLHYVVVTAQRANGDLWVVNLAGNPGKSWAWYDWSTLRAGADDTTLKVAW